MEQIEQKPKVGLGVMIIKDGKVLFGKRKGTGHGDGQYEFPGGHLEHLESFEECAKRETKEECGINIDNIRFQFLCNLKKFAPKHYVHIGMVAEWKKGDPKILEPEKSDGWDWYDLDKIPEPTFEVCKLAVDAYRTGRYYYDL